jgi:hypothetical protein
MSGGVQWKPVIVTPQEYAQLVLELGDRRPTLRTLPAPPWIKTMTDWNLFLEEALDGIPVKLQRPYIDRIAAVRAKLFAAMKRKDKGDIARYTNEGVALQVEWSEAVQALKDQRTGGSRKPSDEGVRR